VKKVKSIFSFEIYGCDSIWPNESDLIKKLKGKDIYPSCIFRNSPSQDVGAIGKKLILPSTKRFTKACGKVFKC